MTFEQLTQTMYAEVSKLLVEVYRRAEVAAKSDPTRMVAADAADNVLHHISSVPEMLDVLQRVEQDYTFFEAITADTYERVQNVLKKATPHAAEYAAKYGSKPV